MNTLVIINFLIFGSYTYHLLSFGYVDEKTISDTDWKRYPELHSKGKIIIESWLNQEGLKYSRVFWFPTEGKFSVHFDNCFMYSRKWNKIKHQVITDLNQLIIDTGKD